MPVFIKGLIYLGVVLSIFVLASVFGLWWKKHKYGRTKTEDQLERVVLVGKQKQITEALLEWLRSIGVGIITDRQEGQTREVKQDEVIGEWGSRKEAVVRVSLRRIHSTEVWREVWQQASGYWGKWKGDNPYKTAFDLVYVVTLEPEVAMPLALPTNTNTKRTFRGEIKSLEWHGFPGLRDKLQADKGLKSRIVGCLRKACEFSVRRLPGDRVGVATSLVLSSREMLRCIEDIAVHVNDYVTEWNRDKQKSTEQEPNNAI